MNAKNQKPNLRGYVAELSKLGEMYAGLTRNAYKPVEQAAAKGRST